MSQLKDVGARRRAEEQRDELLALEHLARREGRTRCRRSAQPWRVSTRFSTTRPSASRSSTSICASSGSTSRWPTSSGIPVDARTSGRRVDAVGSGPLASRRESGFRAALETGDAIMDTELTAETAVVPGLERPFLASFYPVRAADGATAGRGFAARRDHRPQAVRAWRPPRAPGERAVHEGARPRRDTRCGREPSRSRVSRDSCHVYLDARPRLRTPRCHCARRARDERTAPRSRRPVAARTGHWSSTPAVPIGRRCSRSSTTTCAVSSCSTREHAVIVEDHGVVSAIASPLITRGRRLGMLVLNYTKVSGRRYRGRRPPARRRARPPLRGRRSTAPGSPRATAGSRPSSTCSPKPVIS